jgi:hypothetical protein
MERALKSFSRFYSIGRRHLRVPISVTGLLNLRDCLNPMEVWGFDHYNFVGRSEAVDLRIGLNVLHTEILLSKYAVPEGRASVFLKNPLKT